MRHAIGSATADPQRIITLKEREAARSAPALTVDGQTPEDIKARFPRLDWHELWADATPEEWLIWPLLPTGRHGALYSYAGVGKSLLVLELAVAVSRGTEMLGFMPGRPRRVLYVDFENDPRGDVRARLQAMSVYPDELGNLDYLSFPALDSLDSAGRRPATAGDYQGVRLGARRHRHRFAGRGR